MSKKQKASPKVKDIELGFLIDKWFEYGQSKWLLKSMTQDCIDASVEITKSYPKEDVRTPEETSSMNMEIAKMFFNKLVVNWVNVFVKGTEIPFSVKNRELMSSVPDILSFVASIVSKNDNFKAEDQLQFELNVKN